jgi:hypothetical protein
LSKKAVLMSFALLASLNVQAFENAVRSESVGLLDKSCHYSQIYNASRKTFVLYNVLETLALSGVPESKQDFIKKFKTSMKLTKKICLVQSIYSEIDRLVEVEQLDQNTFKFSVLRGALSASGRKNLEGPHSVEFIKRGKDSFLVYKKLYGTYEDQPLMVFKNFETTKDYIRVTGRNGDSGESSRFIFWYDGKSHKKLREEQKAIVTSYENIKPLKNIYSDPAHELQSPKLKVGVIGTGVDYNHPGMAKHLAYRADMEKDLQKIETLSQKLRFNIYESSELFAKDYNRFLNLDKNTGFPLWMDQALGTRRPIDKLIANGKVVPGGVDHETRVTSRIIRSGKAIEIFSVRRSMGGIDTLDVENVVKNFSKEGVKLVNLSFGSTCGRLPKEEASWEKDFALYPEIIFVISAGNSGYNTRVTPFCPATFSTKFKNVISVTALDGNGQLAVYNETPVNYGTDIDLAIKSNNLPVLFPYRRILKWENNAHGATSLGAAEVSRIITEAILEGYQVDAQTVKKHLVDTSVYAPVLKGVTKHSAEVDEEAFKASLSRTQ